MNAFTFILIVLAVLGLLFVSPILTIWALNTVFPMLAIPLNVWTWLAVVWLHIVIASVNYK